MTPFEEIVEKHAAMVRRIATIYERDPGRVDDLVQEVWLAFWQALPRIDGEASHKAYIARVAQNICVTHVRRAVVRRTEPLSDTFAEDAPPLEDVLTRSDQLAKLTDAIRLLPDSLKMVASLYLEDMAVAEIAAALGLSEGNVSVRLYRAKAALRLALDPAS